MRRDELRLTRLRIAGFGHFRDYELGLSENMNLLAGANEAGKSTLLAFIRAVLFGFERRNSPHRYEPERGEFGGELELSTNLGPLRVRRLGTRRRAEGELFILGPDGAPLPESHLSAALTGVSRELFFEVFAFGLDELASFQRLSEQGTVSEALFAAGMQGAQRLPLAVEALKKSAGEIFTPRGQKPELNATLSALEEVQARLREVGDRPALYLEARARLSQLAEELRVAEERLSSVQAEREHLCRVEAAAAELRAAEQLEAELAEMPDLSSFPEAGVSRLEDLLRQLCAVRQDRDELLAKLSALEREREWLSRSPLSERTEAELRAALEGFSSRLPLARSLESRLAATEERSRQLDSALRGLGLGLTRTALLELDLGAAARGGLLELREKMDRAERHLATLADALKVARASREQVEEEVRRLTSQVAALPSTPPSEVRQQQLAFARVETLLGERGRLGERLAERRAAAAALEAELDRAIPEIIPLWILGFAWLLVLLAMGAVWRFEPGAGPAASAAALGLGALATLVQRRAAKSHRAQLEAQSARAQWRAGERERLSGELAQVGAEADELAGELSSRAAEAGVEPDFTMEQRRARDEELAEELEGVTRRVALGQQLESLTAQLSTAARQERNAEADRSVAEAATSRIGRELDALVAPRGFPAGLSPQGALDLWKEAASLAERWRDLATEEKALAADRRSCEEAGERLLSAAKAAGLEGVAALGAEGAASALSTLLKDGREAREALLRLEQKRELLQGQLLGRERSAVELEAQVRALLAQGGCAEEERFRALGESAARFRELRAQLREASSRAEAASGMSLSRLRSQLSAAGGETELSERLSLLGLELERCEGERRNLAEERGSTLERVKAWENDGEVAALRVKEEALTARAGGLAVRCAVDRLALALLGRARRRFEREQQPKVIRLAAELFGELTGGRYQAVYTRADGGRALYACDAAGREWPAEQLSRGTREQLYLAFRLAVIEDFGETRQALPIVLDDILVNFDPVRAQHTLKVLARLSRRHQLIAFTCHPPLAELFRAEGARVQQIQPGGAALAEAAAPD